MPDAARAALPVLAPDGSVVVYRAESGVMVAARRGGAGLSVLVFWMAVLGASKSRPAGSRSTEADLRSATSRETFAHGHSRAGRSPAPFCNSPPVRNSGPIKGLAVSRDGRRIAASVENGGIVVYAEGKSGRTWEVLATAKLNAATTHPLLLDAGRNWVLSGENAGRIGLHAIIEERQLERTAWLISTDQWLVDSRSEGPFRWIAERG